MGVSKVEFGGKTLVDLTGDTVTPQSLLSGYSAHNKAGELIEGLAVIPTVGNGTVTIKQNGVSKGTFTMNQSGNTTIELTDNNTTYSAATQSANGLMSAADKKKLDGIAAGANKTTYTNNLAATVAGTALDAVQGKILKDEIDAIKQSVSKFSKKRITIEAKQTTTSNISPTLGPNPVSRKIIFDIDVDGEVQNKSSTNYPAQSYGQWYFYYNNSETIKIEDIE